MKRFLKTFKCFKTFDIFGYPITLTMKEDSCYHTTFGGIMTFGFIALFIPIIAYSFYNLFSLKKISVNRTEVSNANSYGVIDLNQETLHFALKFQEPVFNNWTKPFMNITLLHIQQIRNISSTIKVQNVVELKPCNISDFKNLESDFLKLQLNDALCPEKNVSLTIRGNYQEDIFSYFQISITTCTNSLFCQEESTIKNISSTLSILNYSVPSNNIIV